VAQGGNSSIVARRALTHVVIVGLQARGCFARPPREPTNHHVVGPNTSGRFYLDPSIGGLRYVYDRHKAVKPEYYVTATGHFYGPKRPLPWFD
jgi:hypothetical protein